MKVYELMDRLSEFPAGAEISICTTMTTEELEEHDLLETDEDGIELYSVSGKADEVELTCGNRVNIYANMKRCV